MQWQPYVILSGGQAGGSFLQSNLFALYNLRERESESDYFGNLISHCTYLYESTCKELNMNE